MTPTNSPALVSDEQAAEWQAMVERITGKTLFTTVTATSAGRDWLKMVNGGFERLLDDRAARVERERALLADVVRLREAAEIGLTLAEMWIHDYMLDEHPSPKKAAERMALLMGVPNWREKEED